MDLVMGQAPGFKYSFIEYEQKYWGRTSVICSCLAPNANETLEHLSLFHGSHRSLRSVKRRFWAVHSVSTGVMSEEHMAIAITRRYSAAFLLTIA